MDSLPITPEREAALKSRIRHLQQSKALTYAELLRDVADEHDAAIRDGGERLKKPISSTFSRWLSGTGDLEREWILWLEEYLDSSKLTHDYAQTREYINSVSEHYMAHATGHYLKIKPETQASAEKEVPGLYAVWVPSNVLRGAFVFGLAIIDIAEPGVLTIQTLQEYRSTAMCFSDIYLERQMQDLGWTDKEPSEQTIPKIGNLWDRLQHHKNLNSTRETLHDLAADTAILLDRLSAQPSDKLIEKAEDNLIDSLTESKIKELGFDTSKIKAIKKEFQDQRTKAKENESTKENITPNKKEITTEEHNEENIFEESNELKTLADSANGLLYISLRELRGRDKNVSQEYDKLMEMLGDEICALHSAEINQMMRPLKDHSLPRKRVDVGKGYFYRIRGAFEAHVWDDHRIAYTRFELPDFERDLGRVTYMKGFCQTRFGKRRFIKPVIFQRLAHWMDKPCLSPKALQPLLDIYPARLLPLEIRAFFVNEAEKLKNRFSSSGNLIVEM